MRSLIIDSNNLLYRIYNIIKASPDLSHIRKKIEEDKEAAANDTLVIDELKVPILLAFLRTFRTYVRDFEPDQTIAVWDKRLLYPSTNFRKEAVNVEYKATRDYSELKIMHTFDAIILEMMKTLGIKQMNPRVMEGDDVIAWLSHTLPGEKVIVSVDQDFLQLVDEGTSVFSPIRKVLITYQNLAEFTGVRPDSFILYKAIKGDDGDNIPGLDGFGKVKSKKLAENWEELQVKLTTEQLEIVNRNIRLVDLKLGYKVHEGEVESYQEQLKAQEDAKPNIPRFKELCKEHHLNEISAQFTSWIDVFRNDDPVASSVASLIGRLNLQA